MLAVETDGGGHGHPEQTAKDRIRDAYLAREGVKMVRIWNSHLMDNVDGILHRIGETAGVAAPAPWPEGSPHPGPLPGGEGEKEGSPHPSPLPGEKEGIPLPGRGRR